MAEREDRTSVSEMAIRFMRNNRAATLAIVAADGKPHISIVYCAIHDDLEIYFTTRAEGRKFKGLVQNPAVSMLFTDHGTLRQLQLSGKAVRIRDLGVQLDILHELMKLRYADDDLPRPPLDLLEAGARRQHVIFSVKPYEMTYADFATGTEGVYKTEFIKII